jgi:hypothetical protein
MIEAILVAFIIAIVNNINVIPVLTKIFMIPIYMASVLYIVIIVLEQLNISKHSKYFTFSILGLIVIPTMYCIFVYHLYFYILIGFICSVVGMLLNQIVVRANGNKMPMFLSLSKLTGSIDLEELKVSQTHQLGDKNTKLKFLTDIIDLGYNVFSIGDVMIFSIFGIVMYGILINI